MNGATPEHHQSTGNRMFRRSPCKRCGAMCYHLCYVGRLDGGWDLVCVDCFGKAIRTLESAS